MPATAFTMDSISTTILLLLLILTCLFLTLSSRGKSRLPPGPTPLPFLGNLLQFHSKDMMTSLTKLSKKYGPVYTVYLGTRPVVVLSGYQAVKEALVNHGEEFSGRGHYPSFFNFTKGNGKGTEMAVVSETSRRLSWPLLFSPGIAFSNGERWKVLRKFSLQILRNLGMRKRSNEELILEEVSFLLKELRKTEGEPLNPTSVLSHSVSNIICSVVFGRRFDYNDERLLTIIHFMNDSLEILSSRWSEWYNLFPSLLHWLPGPHQRLFRNFGRLKDLISRSVRDHQASLDPSSPQDFIDHFLIKIAQEKQDPQSHFHMDTLLMTTYNLLFGGTQTVITTLTYAFLLLTKYPKVQVRVQEEIDHVVGRQRLPTPGDRVAMPYTDAVIHEGTDIITLLNTVHYDPTQFLKPQEFNPEHFLDASQSFKKSPAFMPFSAGPRLCLGESLARMELFLYLSAILQNFSLQPLGAPEDIDLTPRTSGLSNLPRPYELCMRAR
ncbi:cytochrome P450 2F3-like isoform X6 [Pteropus medius]|uniref:cytochrome P450 2F3-like isoform X6 n=1 Tax=Pteropus vampyrus TaxID=132908 RepID=UPI00196AD593|nr:cytochrome P450 2F3-like isoform X6 [Pteropus giganteus]